MTQRKSLTELKVLARTLEVTSCPIASDSDLHVQILNRYLRDRTQTKHISWSQLDLALNVAFDSPEKVKPEMIMRGEAGLGLVIALLEEMERVQLDEGEVKEYNAWISELDSITRTQIASSNNKPSKKAETQSQRIQNSLMTPAPENHPESRVKSEDDGVQDVKMESDSDHNAATDASEDELTASEEQDEEETGDKQSTSDLSNVSDDEDAYEPIEGDFVFAEYRDTPGVRWPSKIISLTSGNKKRPRQIWPEIIGERSEQTPYLAQPLPEKWCWEWVGKPSRVTLNLLAERRSACKIQELHPEATLSLDTCRDYRDGVEIIIGELAKLGVDVADPTRKSSRTKANRPSYKRFFKKSFRT